MAIQTDSTLQFIAGPFNLYMRIAAVSGTNWYPLGIITKEDGLVIRDVAHGEPIDGDNEGETIQDGICTGTNATVSFTLKQARSKALTTLAAQAAYAGRAADASDEQTTDIIAGTTNIDEMWGVVPASGVLWSRYAIALAAVPIFGATPAASSDLSGTGGQEKLHVYHFAKCVREENSTLEYALKHNLRTIPVSLRCLPFTGSDSRKHLYERVATLSGVTS